MIYLYEYLSILGNMYYHTTTYNINDVINEHVVISVIVSTLKNYDFN